MLGSRYVSVKRAFSRSEARGSPEVILSPDGAATHYRSAPGDPRQETGQMVSGATLDQVLLDPVAGTSKVASWEACQPSLGRGDSRPEILHATHHAIV